MSKGLKRLRGQKIHWHAIAYAHARTPPDEDTGASRAGCGVCSTRTFRADLFPETLDAVRSFVDEPFADASILPTYFLSRTVKEEGVTVVLSGDGADELFAGYPTYLAQAAARASQPRG